MSGNQQNNLSIEIELNEVCLRTNDSNDALFLECPVSIAMGDDGIDDLGFEQIREFFKVAGVNWFDADSFDLKPDVRVFLRLELPMHPSGLVPDATE
jgi:hypothetical protein